MGQWGLLASMRKIYNFLGVVWGPHQNFFSFQLKLGPTFLYRPMEPEFSFTPLFFQNLTSNVANLPIFDVFFLYFCLLWTIICPFHPNMAISTYILFRQPQIVPTHPIKSPFNSILGSKRTIFNDFQPFWLILRQIFLLDRPISRKYVRYTCNKLASAHWAWYNRHFRDILT